MAAGQADHDVVVVGASLAGCSVAILLLGRMVMPQTLARALWVNARERLRQRRGPAQPARAGG